MSQTSYNIDHPESYAGMKADAGFDRVESHIADEAIPFGRAVAKGAADGQVKLPTADTDTFRGVSVATHKEQNASGVVQYEQYDAVSVMRQGTIWVDTAVAVNADEDAYVDCTGDIGKLTNVSTSNLATGGKFRSTVAAAGLAKLEINLP